MSDSTPPVIDHDHDHEPADTDMLPPPPRLPSEPPPGERRTAPPPSEESESAEERAQRKAEERMQRWLLDKFLPRVADVTRTEVAPIREQLVHHDARITVLELAMKELERRTRS